MRNAGRRELKKNRHSLSFVMLVYNGLSSKREDMKQLILMILGLMSFLPCMAEEVHPKGLESYVGKDLRKLDDDGSRRVLEKQIEIVTGEKRDEKNWHLCEPWWVKPFARGDGAWMLLEAHPGYDVPDLSAVQVHLFDKSWKRVAKDSFPTGYRMLLKEVSISNENPLKEGLLVAEVTSTGPFIVRGNEKHPAFEQGDSQFEYYALLSDHFVLVRLEDNNRTLVQNAFSWEAPVKGPKVPKRTPDEWIGSLNSKDPVEQLTTLVWLSGRHLTSTEARHENENQESVEDSKLFEAVRDATETKRSLQKLANSQNAWVQEYAKFTLQINGQ